MFYRKSEQQKQKPQKGGSQGKESQAENKAAQAEKEAAQQSRKNIERLLEALQRAELETQARLQRKKMKAKPNPGSKDW